MGPTPAPIPMSIVPTHVENHWTLTAAQNREGRLVIPRHNALRQFWVGFPDDRAGLEKSMQIAKNLGYSSDW